MRRSRNCSRRFALHQEADKLPKAVVLGSRPATQSRRYARPRSLAMLLEHLDSAYAESRCSRMKAEGGRMK